MVLPYNPLQEIRLIPGAGYLARSDDHHHYRRYALAHDRQRLEQAIDLFAGLERPHEEHDSLFGSQAQSGAGTSTLDRPEMLDVHAGGDHPYDATVRSQLNGLFRYVWTDSDEPVRSAQ